jgi:3,5-epimerase/4-reductase
MDGEKGFTEEDPPNFTGSFYSLTKGMVEKVLSLRSFQLMSDSIPKLLNNYSNVLTLRVRMPLSGSLIINIVY